MSGECIGDCCRSVTLDLDYDDLVKSWRAWRAGEPYPRHYEDMDIIAPMLIPLGTFTRNPIMPDEPEHEPKAYFGCKHFAEGKCSIYEDRPQMCRGFPYHGKCANMRCSFEHEPPTADRKTRDVPKLPILGQDEPAKSST